MAARRDRNKQNCYACGLQRCANVNLFRFPKDKVRCKQWIANGNFLELEGADSKVLRYKYCLCNAHFMDDAFRNSNKYRLNKNAIPTVFQGPKKSGSSLNLPWQPIKYLVNKVPTTQAASPSTAAPLAGRQHDPELVQQVASSQVLIPWTTVKIIEIQLESEDLTVLHKVPTQVVTVPFIKKYE